MAGENLFTEKSRSLEVWARPGDVTPLTKYSGNRTSGDPTTAEPGEHLKLHKCLQNTETQTVNFSRLKPLEGFLLSFQEDPRNDQNIETNGQKHQSNINIHTVQTSRQQDNAEPDVTWWIRGCGSAASGGSDSHFLPAFLPAASQRNQQHNRTPGCRQQSEAEQHRVAAPLRHPPRDRESALTPAAPQSSSRRKNTTTCLHTLRNKGKTESIQRVSVWDAECSLMTGIQWKSSGRTNSDRRTAAETSLHYSFTFPTSIFKSSTNQI